MAPLHVRNRSSSIGLGIALWIKAHSWRGVTHSHAIMTAAPLLPIPPRPPRHSALTSLMQFASTLIASGRIDEGEMVLHEAMTIAPESPAPYHALLDLILRSGRDVDALTFCASMLSRLAPPQTETLRVAAETMLTLHQRHAHLLVRPDEPTRIPLSSVGVLDPTPMVMAPEYLRRARTFARSAAARGTTEPAVQLTLAECELMAGNSTLARRIAERSVLLATPKLRGAAMATHALAAFADRHDALALELLRSPHVSELAPALGSGRLICASVDASLGPATANTDPNRVTVRVPCRAQLNRSVRDRTISVRVGPPEVRALQGARVVGGEWIVLGVDDRAWVHGVRDGAFTSARGTRLASMFDDTERNRVLWANDERLLLHAPKVEREHAGRAVMLATGARDDYSRWLLEAIGRLSAIPELLQEPDIRFVVPKGLSSMQREVLSWLGIGTDRLTTVGDDEIVAFDELILVRHRTHAGCVDSHVVEWLRDKLTVPELVTSAPPTRRLFLRSATRSGTRSLVNEMELERHCATLGFEAVDGDAISLAQYRDLFTDAACIVSAEQPHLANLLFAPRGAEVVMLSPRGYARPRHAALAHSLGIGCTFVLGAERPTREAYPAWEYAVDADELRSALVRITG